MASAVLVREGACLSCVRARAGRTERRQNLLQSASNGGTCGKLVPHQLQRHAGNVWWHSSSCKPGVIEMSMKASDTHKNAANSESPVIENEQNVAPAGRWARGKVAALVLAALQSVAPVTPVDVFGGGVPVAEAVLTNPNTRIPKAGDVALRRAIPALNVETKKMQELIEELSYLLRIPQRKPYGSMAKNTKEALEIATKSKDTILNAVGPQFREQADGIYASLMEGRVSVWASFRSG